MPPSLASSHSIQVRRTAGIPSHLRYWWQRPASKRDKQLGAKIIDPEAFRRALDAALPVDSFTSTAFPQESQP
jgi:hypothetical protein